ncbi:hypothetical protein J3E72DRAFT_399920 [Bipolaris maydis]|nr:hypothetical protein J3E72DRAFT_399920 [Bipolaris maydis]
MKADNTNESDIERNMESFAPHMPPEVLQMVFHELDFFDLLRCQRVCKTWRACLPGNDPKLRDKLFVNRTRIQDSQDCVNDKENKYASFGPFADDASKAITVHPMVNKLHKHLHIVFGSLFKVGSDKQQLYHKYHTHNDLMAAIEASKKIVKENNESWKEMLVCVPPLSKIKFGIEFGTYYSIIAEPTLLLDTTDYYRRYDMIYAENRGGVTIGQVIDVIHKHLLKFWATLPLGSNTYKLRFTNTTA